MKAAIVDLDGTLADCSHRLHHVTAGARNWPAFFAGICDDLPVDPVRQVVRSLAKDFKIVLCSGRPEDYRAVTVKWLDDYAIPYDSLYMRPANDTRADHIVKAQLLAGIRADGFEPFIVIDDRESVVAMWRENDLLTLQAAPNSPHVPDTARLILMVGPSGAGKTSWLAQQAKNQFKRIHPSWVISSDQTREDLSGDFRNQDCNEAAFAAIQSVVKARLKAGLPTVVDSTNIRTKDRTSLATLLNVPVTYVVLNRPLAEKKRDGGWRLEVKFADGTDLIERHERTFQSNLKAILRGDGLANVTVCDCRQGVELRKAA